MYNFATTQEIWVQFDINQSPHRKNKHRYTTSKSICIQFDLAKVCSNDPQKNELQLDRRYSVIFRRRLYP